MSSWARSNPERMAEIARLPYSEQGPALSAKAAAIVSFPRPTRARIAYDLYLLREYRDIWLGGPMGLSIEEQKDCVLCAHPLREGSAAGWWERNSDQWLMAHSYCAKRAVEYGTVPGCPGRMTEPFVCPKTYHRSVWNEDESAHLCPECPK